MPDMISDVSESEKGLIIQVNGKDVRFADERFYGRDAAWHAKGTVVPEGLYAEEAIAAIDPKGHMETVLDPVFRIRDGKKIPTEYASVVAYPGRSDEEGGEVLYGIVETGNMSKADWKKMNPNGFKTRSHKHEILTPRSAAAMVNDIVRDEDGKAIRLNTAGFLGKNGSKGVFMSLPMPDFRKETTDALGTKVKNQFTIFLPPNVGAIKVFLTPIMVVCMNTLIASFGEAVTMLKTGHALGTRERFELALTGVYESAMGGSEAIEEAMLYLLNKQITEDEVRQVAEAMYFLPAQPSKTWVGTQTEDKKWYGYEQRYRTAVGNRAAFVEVVKNPRFHGYAGITPQMQSTTPGMYNTMAVLQAATFAGTYAPSEGGELLGSQMMDGPRGNGIMKAVDTLYKITGYSNN